MSIIGIAGHHIGGPRDEHDGIRIVRMALDHGVDFLDNFWDDNESGTVSVRDRLRYSLGQPTSVVITGCTSVGVLEQALDVALSAGRQERPRGVASARRDRGGNRRGRALPDLGAVR